MIIRVLLLIYSFRSVRSLWRKHRGNSYRRSLNLCSKHPILLKKLGIKSIARISQPLRKVLPLMLLMIRKMFSVSLPKADYCSGRVSPMWLWDVLIVVSVMRWVRWGGNVRKGLLECWMVWWWSRGEFDKKCQDMTGCIFLENLGKGTWRDSKINLRWRRKKSWCTYQNIFSLKKKLKDTEDKLKLNDE